MLRVLTLTLALLLTFPAGAQTVEFIDAESLLFDRLDIPRGIVRTKECRDKWNCNPRRGFCPLLPQCHVRNSIRNVRLERISGISYDLPDPKRLPTYSEQAKKAFKNCFSEDPVSYDETLVYSTTERISASMETVLENTQSRSVNISVNPAFLAEMGVEIGGEITNSLTLSLTESNSKSEEKFYELTTPFNIDVPAQRKRIVTMSDLRTQASFPAKITAVLNADLYEVEDTTRDLPGPPHWHERKVGELAGIGSAAKREITLSAIVSTSGTNRNLSVTWSEADLAEGDCDDESEVIAKQEEYSQYLEEVTTSAACEASIGVRDFEQSGNDIDASFNVEVDEQCRNSGSYEFEVRIAEVDDDGAQIGVFSARRGYDYWTYNDETDFVVDWDGSSFLRNNEYLMEIRRPRVTRCNCSAPLGD